MNNKKNKIILVLMVLFVIAISVFVFIAIKFNLFSGNKQGDDNFKISGDTNIIAEAGENYEVLPDGTKINNNKQIENAVFTLDKIKLSEFKISELNGSTTIDGKIENTTDEEVKDVTLLFKLYNSADELAHEYALVISKIEPKAEQYIQTNVMADFANVARIEAEIQE